MALGRMSVVLMGLLVAGPAAGVTIKDEQRIKDDDGKTIVLVVACDGCKAGKPAKKGTACLPGAAEGFWDGEPCGGCLMKSNYGVSTSYPFDLTLAGSLKDAAGKPANTQFVRLSMPNGWSVTTRTNDKGEFRIVLGATAERKSKTPLVRQLGTFTAKKTASKGEPFSLFMLPEQFKPCAKKK